VVWAANDTGSDETGPAAVLPRKSMAPIAKVAAPSKPTAIHKTVEVDAVGATVPGVLVLILDMVTFVSGLRVKTFAIGIKR
jgi:hypothetical protein